MVKCFPNRDFIETLLHILVGCLNDQACNCLIHFYKRHEIDLPTLASLTDEELKEIGIPTFAAHFCNIWGRSKEVKKQKSFIIIFGTEVVLDFLFFLDFAAHS